MTDGRRVRVGVDVRCLGDGTGMRGFARYTSEVVHALARRDDVEIIGYSDRDVDFLPDEIVVHRFAGRREIGAEQLAWPRLLRRDAIDVVLGPANRGLPLVTPCPAVLTLHDAVEWDRSLVAAPHGRDRVRFEYSNVASLTNATRVITVSEFSAHKLHTVLGIPRARIRVVYEAADQRFRPSNSVGVADAQQRNDAEVATRLSINRDTVVYVGGFDAKKDIPTLIRGFADAARDRAERQLVLIGSHPPFDDIAAIAAECDVAAQVRAIGYVDDADLPSIYRRAGCFATAAAFEGFGLPAMEAMACGLAVVVPDAGSLPEIVGDGGIAYPVRSVAALGNAIAETLDPVRREHWIARAQRRAAQFSWDATAEQTLTVLREAANVTAARRVVDACRILPNAKRWVA